MFRARTRAVRLTGSSLTPEKNSAGLSGADKPQALACLSMASRNCSGPVKIKSCLPSLASDILEYPVVSFISGPASFKGCWPGLSSIYFCFTAQSDGAIHAGAGGIPAAGFTRRALRCHCPTESRGMPVLGSVQSQACVGGLPGSFLWESQRQGSPTY